MDNKEHIDQIIKDKAANKNYDFKQEYWDEMEIVLNNNEKKIISPFFKGNFVKYLSLNVLFLMGTVIVAFVLTNKNDLNSKNIAYNISEKNELPKLIEISHVRKETKTTLNDEPKIEKPIKQLPQTITKSVSAEDAKHENATITAKPQEISIKQSFFPPLASNNDTVGNQTKSTILEDNNVDSTKINPEESQNQFDDNNGENETEEAQTEPPIKREFDFNEFVLRTANEFWENPSVTALDNQKVVSINYENFNPKFNSDPNQFLLAFDTKINRRLGLGTFLSYYNHNNNYTLATANLSISYALRLNEYQKLIVGSGFNYVSNSFYGLTKSNYYNKMWGDLQLKADEKYFDLNTGLIYIYRKCYLMTGISHAVNTANNGLSYNISGGTSFEISGNLKLYPSVKFINDQENQTKNQFLLVNYLSIKEKYIAGLEINFSDVNVNPHFGAKLSDCMSFNLEPGISLNKNVELNYLMAQLSFHISPCKQRKI